MELPLYRRTRRFMVARLASPAATRPAGAALVGIEAAAGLGLSQLGVVSGGTGRADGCAGSRPAPVRTAVADPCLGFVCGIFDRRAVLVNSGSPPARCDLAGVRMLCWRSPTVPGEWGCADHDRIGRRPFRPHRSAGNGLRIRDNAVARASASCTWMFRSCPGWTPSGRLK